MIGPATYSAQHQADIHLEGFEAPIHGSLGSPILLGGAPRGLAIVNGTLAAAVSLGVAAVIALRSPNTRGHETGGLVEEPELEPPTEAVAG